jgi:hypothetical protein
MPARVFRQVRVDSTGRTSRQRSGGCMTSIGTRITCTSSRFVQVSPFFMGWSQLHVPPNNGTLRDRKRGVAPGWELGAQLRLDSALDLVLDPSRAGDAER